LALILIRGTETKYQRSLTANGVRVGAKSFAFSASSSISFLKVNNDLVAQDYEEEFLDWLWRGTPEIGSGSLESQKIYDRGMA
jgi:hypothetical protein